MRSSATCLHCPTKSPLSPAQVPGSVMQQQNHSPERARRSSSLRDANRNLTHSLRDQWCLAARSRGNAIDSSSQRAARCPRRSAWKAGDELPRTFDVAVGRLAVYLDDVTHLLPLYLFQAFSRRSAPRTGSTWAQWRFRLWPRTRISILGVPASVTPGCLKCLHQHP